MKTMLIQIPDDAIGVRLDQWVATNTTLSRSAFKQLVEKQLVKFNDSSVKKAGFKIPFGGQLEMIEKKQTYEAMPMALDIVYEDEYLLIVNKPRGMLVYPTKDKEERTLVNG